MSTLIGLKFNTSNIFMGVERELLKRANYLDLCQSRGRTFDVAFFEDLTNSVQHSNTAKCNEMA